jgi:NNP family nitrate/nitrite transporter-like MFS transporter
MSLPSAHDPEAGQRSRVLWISTTAFTLLFAVWLMLGMLGVKVREELQLSPGQMYNLAIAAILAGALFRFNFGVWSDRYGGRRVFTALLLFTAVPTFLVSRATDYDELLLCAALYGLAGNAYTAGIAWTAAWFPRERQGFALGVFGAGNVGASVTKLVGPVLIAVVPAAGFFGGAVPGGWRFIPVLYSALLVVMAAVVWLFTPHQDRTPAKGRPFREVVAPLRFSRAWQYSLHYVVMFGAYVALSAQLPTYYIDLYGDQLAAAFGLDRSVKADQNTLFMWVGWLSAVCYIFPASLLRPLGGYLSDRCGAFGVTAAVFVGMIAAGFLLSLPIGLGVWAFTAVLFVLGCGMGVGKASVYKMIPDHFPRDVGAVGGLVGMLGALGGVLLPLAWKWLEANGVAYPQKTFAAVLALTLCSTAWFAADAATERRPASTPEPTPEAEPAPAPG